MPTDAPPLMRLAGFVPLAERGFAIPTFERADIRGNAPYLAIPKVEGDHVAPIASFEQLNGPPPCPLEVGRLVEAGDRWLDVFLWDGRELFGTVHEIFESLRDRHDQIGTEAPLTFLDLGLAVGSPDTPTSSEVARTFLHRTLGLRSGERSFREVIVRPGVALEIRRWLHRVGEPVPFGTSIGFDAIPIGEKAFHIALDGETLRRAEAGGSFDELRASVSRFGEALGLLIEILEPPAAIAAEGISSTLPSPPAEADRASALSVRRPRSRLLGFAQEMALDLGSNNARVHARGRGVVLSEPSVIAIRTFSGVRKVLAVGNDAKLAMDREPSGVEVIRPVRDGAIADLDAAVAMLVEFMRRVRPQRLFRRPLDIVVCLPAGATQLESRALREAAVKAGATKVWLIEAPLAAAIGASLPVLEPVGSMIVQIGAGTTEVAVAALRGLVYSISTRTGGDAMDEAIVNYLRRDHNLLVGLRSAERLKREIGAADRPADGVGRLAHVRGRDLVNSVPKEIEVSTAEIAAAIAEPVGAIVEAVRISLENTAPELAADIVDGGIVLAGGTALLAGLAGVISHETGLAVRVAADPANCVTIGLARILDDAVWRSLLRSS